VLEFSGENMFTIRIYSIGCKIPELTTTTRVETLTEAEIIALDRAERIFRITNMELVYIEDLDYYVYSHGIRIGRLTIQPIYTKVRTKE